MAAPTDYYVDPSIAGNSGTGTIGDPFGDLQYALDSVTQDTTDGDRFNIKAGTDEVLTASLNLTTYGTPNNSYPLIFQGYTSAQGDGGIGGIDGNGDSIFSSSATDALHFIDLHMHNFGSNPCIQADNNCSVINCEINNGSGTVAAIDIDNGCIVLSNYIHDVEEAIIALNGSLIAFNRVDAKSTGSNIMINGGTYAAILFNVVVCNAVGQEGIRVGNTGHCLFNSVYNSAAGTERGIGASTSSDITSIMNNLIEGWSGAGGFAIEFLGGGTKAVVMGNAEYDCTTGYEDPDTNLYSKDNETLTATPFTNAASDDFTPVDTGNVKEGSQPREIGQVT